MRNLFLALFIALTLSLVSACGGSSGSTTGAAADEGTATDTFAVISDTIEDVTPRVDFTAANTSLDEWSDWRYAADDDPEDSNTTNAVFEKLLSDSAESVFAPAEFLEEVTSTMDIVDEAGIPEWDEGGSTTISQINPDTQELESMDVTIIIPETELTIPAYFQDKIEEDVQESIVAALDRILVFNHSEWVIYLAIGEDDDYYYATSTAVNDTLGETQTIVGYMNRTTNTLTLHYTSASDDGDGDGVYTRWTGNPDENWFRIAQVTGSSGGGAEVVGGGENMDAEGSIAFKARNNDDDGDGTDVYYLTDLTIANIEDDVDPGTAPVFAEPETGTGSIEYIIEGNAKCLGWIGQGLQPDTREEIAWAVTE